MKIYANNEHAKYWVDFAKLGECVHDIDQWTSETHRVAFVDTHDGSYDHFRHSLRITKLADLVFLFVMEFTDGAWYREFDRPNVVLILNGTLNCNMRYAKVVNYYSFLDETARFYKTRPHFVDSLTSHTKTLYFDVLLGRQKVHRDMVYHELKQSQNIVTYFGNDQDQDIRDRSTQEFLWPLEVLPKPTQAVPFTMQDLDLDGVTVSLSKILPIDIYNQTYYSLVTETCVDNDWSFFTEKIAKPLIAGRLFLVVAGQHYLRNLHKLGFKTFDSILDESYDSISDCRARTQAVLDQVHWLQTQEPHSILQAIRPIVEHNQHLMFDTDWQAPLRDLDQYLKI